MSNFGSGSGSRITIDIYLYQIWYWVPDPVNFSFYRICSRVPDPVFLVLVDPVLGTGLNARSRTGYQIRYWVTDHNQYFYTGSGTRYQILVIILSTGSVVGYQIRCFIFLIGSRTGYQN